MLSIVKSYEKILGNGENVTKSFFLKKPLARGQAPNEFLLARSEKSLAPGVGQWDLSAPDRR